VIGEAAIAVIMAAFGKVPKYGAGAVVAPLPCVNDGQHPGSLSLHPTIRSTMYEPSES
jgi:hypothetical protein